MVVYAQRTLIPRTAADLVPEVSGTVEWVSPNLVPGGNFDVGDALLRIDARDYQDAVERTSAAARRAEANEEQARYELNRVKELDAAEGEASTRIRCVGRRSLCSHTKQRTECIGSDRQFFKINFLDRRPIAKAANVDCVPKPFDVELLTFRNKGNRTHVMPSQLRQHPWSNHDWSNVSVRHVGCPDAEQAGISLKSLDAQQERY